MIKTIETAKIKEDELKTELNLPPLPEFVLNVSLPTPGSNELSHCGGTCKFVV